MDLTLNNLQWLIYHKTKLNKTKYQIGNHFRTICSAPKFIEKFIIYASRKIIAQIDKQYSVFDTELYIGYDSCQTFRITCSFAQKLTKSFAPVKLVQDFWEDTSDKFLS